MNRPLAVMLATLSLSLCHLAMANVEVGFVESAPKDRFVIKNTGSCELTNLVMQFDLSGSAGKLIFDTTATGAGVEVFQPFEVRSGTLALSSGDDVKDGEQMLSISIPMLSPDTSVSFTIDVDDTLTNSDLGQIRVSGSEIEGGSVELLTDSVSTGIAYFDNNSSATLELQPCS